jgi:hypothetical protein
MIIAFLVVRKRFSGKEALDFVSNLGARSPARSWGSALCWLSARRR